MEAASAIARIFGISERFIGLTIVAFGTSLPELVTSVAAARRGNSDIAVGNIVGSNLFNIMFVVGITAVIVPVVYQPTFRVDSIVAVAAAVLLLVCVYRGRVLKRRARTADACLLWRAILRTFCWRKEKEGILCTFDITKNIHSICEETWSLRYMGMQGCR